MRPAPTFPPICKAIRQMINESPHIAEDVAELFEVNVTTVRRWMRDTPPDYDTVAALEEFCKKKRGYALRLAGYVEDEGDSTEERIINDKKLHEIVMPMVLDAYRRAVEISAEQREGRRLRPQRKSS